MKTKLYLALSDNANIQEIPFTHDTLSFFLKTSIDYKGKYKNAIWLFADTNEDENQDEIVVTENFEKLIKLIENDHFSLNGEVHLFLYHNYEEAYKACLDMREPNAKCYDLSIELN